MEKTLLRHLQVEIERQCQFAMIALQDLEEASANGDRVRFTGHERTESSRTAD